jgi:DNA-binding response OmpR family regulator
VNNVIILDNRPYIRCRVKELVEQEGVIVHEANNSNQLLNKYRELNNEVDLIIIELNLKDEDGIEVIKKVRRRNINTPFMVLTAVNTRDAFIKSIKAGAVDYFLKPFENKLFYDRVMRQLFGKKENEAVVEKASEVDYKEYLEIEIENSKIAGQKVSIIMSMLYRAKEDFTLDIKHDNLELSEYIYKSIRYLMNNAGAFGKYGANSFIAVYSDCDYEQICVIEEEAKQEYIKLKETAEFIDVYDYNSVSASYPDDGNTVEELLNTLVIKMNEFIRVHKEE